MESATAKVQDAMTAQMRENKSTGWADAPARPTGPIREIYTFEFPVRLRKNGMQSVGIAQITSNEELQAAKRSGQESMRLPYQMALAALAEVNGKPVSLSDGSSDKAWDAFSPKQRILVLSAYNEVNVPDEADLKGFLASQMIRVG